MHGCESHTGPLALGWIRIQEFVREDLEIGGGGANLRQQLNEGPISSWNRYCYIVIPVAAHDGR